MIQRTKTKINIFSSTHIFISTNNYKNIDVNTIMKIYNQPLYTLRVNSKPSLNSELYVLETIIHHSNKVSRKGVSYNNV